MRVLVVLPTVLALAGCSGSEPVATERSEPTVPTTAGTTPSTTGEDRVATAPLRVKLARIAANLDAPTHVAFAPGEHGRLYVVEQAGRIQAVEDGKVGRQPFLDISGLVVSGGEQGLLSAAFHPDYERNRLFYVDYTDVNGDTRVVEYEARDDGAPARLRELLFVDQPYANHNGGQLAFGPDGRLYVGMGDGGSGGDPENRAQNLSERLGKLLSLDVDRPGGRWRIDGYGLRNPWRFSFDRKSGDLWIGDVGQGEWEEIDHSPRESLGLENYGWDVLEGTHSHEDKDPNPRGRLVTPVAEYSHEEGCSVTGGFVYRGERIPAARGRYFYGDYCSGRLWTVSPQDGNVSRPRRLPFDLPTLSSFGEDAAGELYLAALDGGIYRLDPR